MAKCKSGSKTYLDYKCYEYLKPRFDEISLSESSLNNLKKAVEILRQNYTILFSYEPIFKEITSRVTSDGVFYDADPRIPCNYINYLLNRKLTSNGMHKNNSIYNFFKKFVAEVYKIRKGNYHPGLVCDIDIKRLDDNIYDRMKILYQMYDMYYQLKSTHEYWVDVRCDIYGRLIKKYNDSIEVYQLQDEELLNKILFLKDLTKNLTLPPDNRCPHRIKHFHEPLLYLKKLKDEEEAKQALIKKQEEEAQQAQQAQQALIKKQQEELEQEEQLKSVLESNGEVSPSLSILRTPENNALSPTLNVGEEGLSVNPKSSRRQEYLEENKFIDSQTPLLDQLGRQKEGLEQSEVKNHELENYVSQTDTPGVLGTLQNTISSFIKDVEPAPVLGVSGGMGALFLLFKYTPVGSFFGGRRGRMRQIPSSFRGFPPGEFPDFQEYDVGYIGYGPMHISPLAE